MYSFSGGLVSCHDNEFIESCFGTIRTELELVEVRERLRGCPGDARKGTRLRRHRITTATSTVGRSSIPRLSHRQERSIHHRSPCGAVSSPVNRHQNGDSVASRWEQRSKRGLRSFTRWTRQLSYSKSP